jgi:hypothetical protein
VTLFTLAETVTRTVRVCGCLADVTVFGHTNCPVGQPREAQDRREQGLTQARAQLQYLAEQSTRRPGVREYTLAGTRLREYTLAGTRRRPV